MAVDSRADVLWAVRQQLEIARDKLRRVVEHMQPLTPSRLSQPHGEGPRTRAEVLASYQLQVERWEEAVGEVARFYAEDL